MKYKDRFHYFMYFSIFSFKRVFFSHVRTGDQFTDGKQLAITNFDQKFERDQDKKKKFFLVTGHYKGILNILHSQNHSTGYTLNYLNS